MRNMKNSILEKPLIHIIIWIRNDDFMNEEDDEVEGSRRILPTNQIKNKKGPVQPPTRREGWYLFQRASDDNSRFTTINMNLKLPGSKTPWWKKELQRMVDPPWRMKTTMGTRDNSRWRKECYKRSYDQRVTVDHGEWCIRYDGTSVQSKVRDSPYKE